MAPRSLWTTRTTLSGNEQPIRHDHIHIARLQRIKDNDADYVDAKDMLAELREDNQSLAARLREVHDVVDEVRDIATASLIENWIDETERRVWFLFEASRRTA